MSLPEIHHAFVRYYIEPPEKKSLQQCYSHGSDHRAYQWSQQIDPRWNENQRRCYLDGYEGRPYKAASAAGSSCA